MINARIWIVCLITLSVSPVRDLAHAQSIQIPDRQRETAIDLLSKALDVEIKIDEGKYTEYQAAFIRNYPSIFVRGEDLVYVADPSKSVAIEVCSSNDYDIDVSVKGAESFKTLPLSRGVCAIFSGSEIRYIAASVPDKNPQQALRKTTYRFLGLQ